MLEIRGDKKILVLYDGRTINNVNGEISEFKFSKTDFNISKFTSNTTTHQKTQETKTIELVQCLLITEGLKKKLESPKVKKINNCNLENLENIHEELYSRLIKPFYTTFLITISLLFILKSQSNHTFKSFKFKIYFLGFIFIVFLESSSKFISTNLLKNSFVSFLPFFFIFIIYIYFLRTLEIKKK